MAARWDKWICRGAGAVARSSVEIINSVNRLNGSTQLRLRRRSDPKNIETLIAREHDGLLEMSGDSRCRKYAV